MSHIPENDRPLNLELVGYDELDRLPLSGHASDRELFVDLPTNLFASAPHVPPRSTLRELLANDFSFGGA